MPVTRRTLILRIVCLLTGLSGAAGEAQIQQFPYEAVVQADDVYVRSGPGKNYYPTGKVGNGDRVTVHRHDPGGWYMIAPPPGSFSWIDAGLVRKTGADQGVIEVPPLAGGQPARAIVRIGSEFGDDHSIYSRELRNGDVVRIIGEQTLPRGDASVRMYKIAPPDLEYRWVKGDFIVAANSALQKQQDLDPFSTPSAMRRPTPPEEPVAAEDKPVERELTREQNVSAMTPASGTLQQLDHQYAAMMAQDPSTWRLDELEAQYRALLAGADERTAAGIEQRLRAIDSRRQVYSEFMNFLQLTSQTSRREAELLSMQRGLPFASPTAYPGGPAATQGPPVAPQPNPVPQPGGSQPPQPQPVGPRLGPTIEPIPEQELPSSPQSPVAPRFDGAGIVQRSGATFGTAPTHVLISPEGRLLAFLQPVRGVNLDAYVGHSVGVIGQREFDPRLQADRIVVRRLSPVQLKP